MVYFDYNATAPLHPAARAAWLDACENLIGNPSSPHRLGGRAENALAEARQKLAKSLGCDPHEIVWTSGGTESSNTVFQHFAQASQNDEEVWTSAIEHPAVLAPANFHFKKKLRLIPVSSSGVVELDWLKDSLRQKRPCLIAVMAANNETGVLQPWEEIAKLCREKEIPFFCDAVQWLGKLPVQTLGQCDFLSGSAQKFGGPKGVGFLKVSAHIGINPFILGGRQQDGRRAGTENVAGVLSMVAALAATEEALAKNEQGQREGWRNEFETKLLKLSAKIVTTGANQKRLWNTAFVFLPESPFRWVVKLDKAGFAASTGSACATGQEVPSHVLSAMGYVPDQISRAIRFSSGWETLERDWVELFVAINCIVEENPV
jgi:cysteine desulfurase